jgi:hypothetical protein
MHLRYENNNNNKKKKILYCVRLWGESLNSCMPPDKKSIKKAYTSASERTDLIIIG